MKYPAMHWIQIRRDEEWIDLLSCPAENVSEWKRKHNSTRSRQQAAPDSRASEDGRLIGSRLCPCHHPQEKHGYARRTMV